MKDHVLLLVLNDLVRLELHASLETRMRLARSRLDTIDLSTETKRYLSYPTADHTARQQ